MAFNTEHCLAYIVYTYTAIKYVVGASLLFVVVGFRVCIRIWHIMGGLKHAQHTHLK